jgi:hypothetical protein
LKTKIHIQIRYLVYKKKREVSVYKTKEKIRNKWTVEGMRKEIEEKIGTEKGMYHFVNVDGRYSIFEVQV